jgi:hypothetical protein
MVTTYRRVQAANFGAHECSLPSSRGGLGWGKLATQCASYAPGAYPLLTSPGKRERNVLTTLNDPGARP